MLLRLNETLKYVSLLGDTFPHGIYGVYTLPLSLGIQTIVRIIIVNINIDLATTDCIWVILRHYLPVDPSLHLYNSFHLVKHLVLLTQRKITANTTGTNGTNSLEQIFLWNKF